MSYRNSAPLIALLMLLLTAGCGSEDEDPAEREQARQDSLEQVRQDSLQKVQQARQDSLAKAQTDSNASRTSRTSSISFTDSGAFSIQVESWRSEHKAREQAEMWKERGYGQAYIVQHGDNGTGDVWYRVRLGRVETREDARSLQQQIKDEYQQESWIASAN